MGRVLNVMTSYCRQNPIIWRYLFRAPVTNLVTSSISSAKFKNDRIVTFSS